MDLRKLFLDYFISQGHIQIPSASLVPENDSSVLFNTAGMQPLIPYLMGQSHPCGKRLCNYQKCLRTNDLDKVGDTTHHTFFEMLGNWSLGDYFKEEAIKYSFEFLTTVLHLPLEKLAVSVFKGKEEFTRDTKAAQTWLKLGLPEKRIAFLGEEDNWWPNLQLIGPCGTDTEIFYWRSNDQVPEVFDPNDERWVEIWNNVFMEYNHLENGQFVPLKQKNIDTGMGIERTTAILEGVNDNYQTSIWQALILELEKISGLKYENDCVSMRIIADHIRTTVFVLADSAGIKPSNTDQGYILRRLIRRAIRHAKKLNIDLNSSWLTDLAKIVITQYQKFYPEIIQNQTLVLKELILEKEKFNRTLEKGLKEFKRLTTNYSSEVLNKDIAFRLYDTYGFPLELTKELAQEVNLRVDEDGFKEKYQEHQAKSRVGAEAKFKGGLATTGEKEIRFHTATHLLNAALKLVIGCDVHQKGSNITSERMRFDFSAARKLTEEEINQVEKLVNQWIKADLPVIQKQMTKKEALASGAECMFIEKYPEVVTVYLIGNISQELCGGPHVQSTAQLGGFKIIKEEASSAGVRRIKAVLN